MKKTPYFLLLLSLLFISSTIFAQKIDVVYVRSSSNYNDSATIAAIAGYADSTAYEVTELVKAEITFDDTTRLNAADVVILGRNIGSSNLANCVAEWDSVKTPVITSNSWGIRGAKGDWMESTSPANVATGDHDTILSADILVDDPVFEGFTSSDTVDFWQGQFSVYAANDGPGNGVLLAKTLDSRPLFIRWEADVEFYTGAGHAPKGPRTFIGCASDHPTPNGYVNYFGYTEIGKTIFFNELARLSGYVPRKKVVYVRDTRSYNDSVVIAEIKDFANKTAYEVTELVVTDAITLDDTTQLNAADVVIMGRNFDSKKLNQAMVAWDSVKSPVISMHQWGLRNLPERAQWVPATVCENLATGDNDTILPADILVDDTVFSGLDIGVEYWWRGQFSVFGVDAENDDHGNGVLLAKTTDNRALFIRWEAGVEFFPGAGHAPKGPRTYIGCGSDDKGTVNYFGFTPEGRNVFFNEMARLAGLPLVTYVSSDATLSDLTVDNTTITDFDPAITTYNVTLAMGTTSVSVGATATDNGATILSGTGTIDVSSGSGSTDVVVEAEAGNTLTYTINFSVGVSNDATLSDLSVDNITVTGFNKNTETYNVDLPDDTQSVTVGATATDDGATILSGTGTIDVSSGSATDTVKVQAEDGITIKKYTINFTVAKSSDATLSDLTVNNTTITGFDAATTSYVDSLDAGTTSVTVGATTTDNDAKILSGTGSVDVSSGSATDTIIVEAEDGITIKKYTVKFVVKKSSGISDASSLSLNIYPNPVISTLSIDVESEISSVTVYNTNGTLVKSIDHLNSNSTKIDVTGLNDGLYIVNILTINNETIQSSFIKR